MLDIEALRCIHEVALKLMNVVKRCNLHWIDQLVVPDLCQQDLSQVFLEFKTTFDYVNEIFDCLVSVVDHVFKQVNLCMQDAKGNLKHPLSIELDCVIGLH